MSIIMINIQILQTLVPPLGLKGLHAFNFAETHIPVYFPESFSGVPAKSKRINLEYSSFIIPMQKHSFTNISMILQCGIIVSHWFSKVLEGDVKILFFKSSVFSYFRVSGLLRKSSQFA